MKKQVKVGQCYENHDIIYEIVKPWNSINKKAQGKDRFWWTRSVINKAMGIVSEKTILTWRRPFNTEG